MIRLIKLGSLFLLLFLAFFVLTFPFERLGPRLAKELEGALRPIDRSLKCEVTGFAAKLPLRVTADTIVCRGSPPQPLLNLRNFSVSIWPWRQTLETLVGKGRVEVTVNASFFSPPSRLSLVSDRLPLDELSPILGLSLSRLSPFLPSSAKLSGVVVGSASLPLKNFQIADGSIDLSIQDLKFPEQSLLQTLGLKEIPFSKAVAKVKITNGKLSIQEVAALSSILSGKMEGQMELAGTLAQSSGSLFMKWKVVRSDALMNSPLGAGLANTPCPSPDAEGFCTRRIGKLSELFAL